VARDPILEKSLSLPLGYVATVRLRPTTVRRAAIGVLPWALYVMMPAGRREKLALSVARRVSPLIRQKSRR